jgi:hypothetical protein
MQKFREIIIFFIFIGLCIGNVEAKTKLLENDYYVVIGDNLNLRMEPFTNSPVKEVLSLGKKVKKIKSQGESIIINNIKGEWFLVDTESYDKSNPKSTLKGWVFSGFLSDGSEFEEVKKINKTIIEGTVGDANFIIQINEDGSVKSTTTGYYNKEPLIFEGKLYTFKNLYIEYNKKHKSCEIYIREADGRLCTMFGLCSK